MLNISFFIHRYSMLCFMLRGVVLVYEVANLPTNQFYIIAHLNFYSIVISPIMQDFIYLKQLFPI